MLRVGVGVHVDDDILDTGSLRARPVNTSSSGASGNSSHVDNQVADLAKEDVGRDPALSSILVFVTIDETHAGEAGGGLESSGAVGVSNELSEVVVNDRRRNRVGSSREVNDCRSDGGGLIGSRASTVTITDSLVNGISVIGRTVT